MSRMCFTLAMGALLAAGCSDTERITGKSVTPPQDIVQFDDASVTVTWNQIARDLVVSHRINAFAGIRLYALVSIAQYNAVVAAEQASSVPQRPSETAAVASASAAVLTHLFPEDAELLQAKLEEQYWAPRAPRPQTQDFAAGVELGRTVAAGILTRADGDGFFAPFTGTVPECPGCWLAVPTPPAFATLGQAKTFILTSGSQFRPAPPPVFGSAEYLAGLAEVRQIARTRTAEQDSIARFWALPPGTVGPLGFWNAVGSQLVVRYRLDERRAAHALAMMNVAAFDAVIASHDAKFTYWLIRPTQADPTITLAIGLPSFPSYPSNHATVSAAAATVLGSFFPNERPALDAQADQAGLSRVFGGIHYRFDVDTGLALGKQIGTYVLDQDVVGRDPLLINP